MKGIFVSLPALFLAGIILSSCATGLSGQGRSVVVKKSDPAPECREIGSVECGEFLGGSTSLTSFKHCLRNKTAGIGGNYLRLEFLTKGNSSGPGGATGTAYDCPVTPR